MPATRHARNPSAGLPACAIAPALAAPVPSAHAITLIVDGGADAVSDTCADAVAGDRTLRGAILAANARPGADRIVFDIPTSNARYQAATAHWRLTPAADLPTISDDLEIDDYSRPGARENGLRPDQGGSDALIEIELAGAPDAQLGPYAVGGNPRLHTVRLPAAALLGRPLALIAVDADGNTSKVASEAIHSDDLEP